MQFVQGLVVPLVWPKFSGAIFQTWFQIGKRDVFVCDFALKGILSGRVYCRIETNAYVARDPDENNVLSASNQF